MPAPELKRGRRAAPPWRPLLVLAELLSDPAPPPLHNRLLGGGWVLVLLALPWLLLGVGSAAMTAQFLAAAEQGVAEAVSSREHLNSRGDSTWTTDFLLIAPDGARLTARWTGERGFAPGEAVRVRYRRAPLIRIQPGERRAAWLWAVVLGCAGGVHLLVGAALISAGALLRRRHLAPVSRARRPLPRRPGPAARPAVHSAPDKNGRGAECPASPSS